MADPKRLAALHKQGGIYKPMSEITPGTQDLLDSPTPAWLDRDYPYVAPPGEDHTLQELDYLVSLIPLREKWASFIRTADEDKTPLFVTLCSELGAPCDVEALNEMASEAAILITKLKWLYNRPRPYQVAAQHGVGFSPVGSTSAQSPAYPSGHTIQAYLMASRLSETSPQHRKAFMDLAEKVSFSRAVAGYHWPSDLAFGQDIFRHIVMPLMPSAVRVAKTYTVNKGDLVWYGKYKNQRGKVKNFGMGDKGDPTITVEQLPAPSSRKPKKKSPKTLNLFSIRPRKKDEHDEAAEKTAEALPGGKARGKKPSDFDAGELAAGVKVEQEHLVGNGYSKQERDDIAREVAMDHLAEIPDYYTRLDKMESEAGVKHARGNDKKASEVSRVFRSRKPFTGFRPEAQKEPSFKPGGLWYSCGSSWDDWCRTEMPSGITGAPYVYQIEVNLSRMLVIRNAGDFQEFEGQYTFYPKGGGRPQIDWKAVARDYDGIEICPYQSKFRMSSGWYYPWDVASGCIWGSGAFKSVEPVEVCGVGKQSASGRGWDGIRKGAAPKKYEHIDFVPPKGVADAAAKGLELRQKASPSNKGGLTPAEASKHGIGSGVQRAVNLKNHDPVSPKVIKQMRGFLSRSEKSSEISAENRGTPWNDKGYVAWLLWGGDPAKAWTDKIIKQMDAADEKEKQKTAVRLAASKALSKKEVPKADGSGTTTIYEYGPRQVAQRNKSKAVRIEALRQKITDLRKQAHSDLTSEDPDTRLAALAVSLIDETYARVGNEKSAKDGHYGVTNWQADHVTLADKSATIRYTGKSGVEQAKRITNARVLAALRKALEGKSKGDKVLCDGDECSILAKDVNAYLKPFEITAKDIRGLHANEEMKHHLREQRKAGPELPRARKDKDKILKAEFKAALELASAAVGHKDSTLRSQYLVPSMEASYTHDGAVLDRLDKKATLSAPEKEDRESARLVRQSPKFKPPRKDKERGRVKDTEPDTDPDESQDQKDRSNNYKDASARVALRFLLGGPSIRLTARRERQVGDTWEGKDGKWSAKGKDKTESGFASDDAAKAWLTGGPEPGADAASAPEDGSPAKTPKPPAKKGPLTREQKQEMVKTLSEGLTQDAGKILGKLPEALLRAVAEELGEPAKAVVDAMLGDTASLVERAAFAKATLKRIPSGKPPTDEQTASAEALLDKYERAGTSLESMEDELEDMQDSAPDRSHEDYAAHEKKVKALTAEIKGFQKALKTVESGKTWEGAPSPKEIAGALVATRAAEVRKDPLLLDLSSPLTSKSTEPLNLEEAAQKEFMAKMGDLTVSSTSEYQEMPKEDRDAHRKGLGKHLDKLEKEGLTDTEQYHSTLAQTRGLQMASALEDGANAVGVNSAFQTFLKAAESQGPDILDKFIKLNVTGAAEGDAGAQAQFRSVLREMKPAALMEMVPEDNPARGVLERLSGSHLTGAEKKVWDSHMDAETIALLQEHAEDMLMEEIMFTDMDMVREGKTTGEQKKKKPGKKTTDRRTKQKQKTTSLLELLRKQWEEAQKAAEGVFTSEETSPAPKKTANHTLVGVYDFAPWGTLSPS